MSDLIPTPHKVVEYAETMLSRQIEDESIKWLMTAYRHIASAGNNFIIDAATLDALEDEDANASLESMIETNCVRLPFSDCYIEIKDGIEPDRFKSVICAWEVDGLIRFVVVIIKSADVLPVPIVCEYLSNNTYRLRILKSYVSIKNTKFWESAKAIVQSIHPDLMKFLVLLNTRGVIVEKEPAPERLNKQRTKKGRPPIQSYSVVRIDDRVLGSRGALGHDRKSPRLHHRRAHVWGRFTRPREQWQLRAATLVGAGEFLPKHYQVGGKRS